MAGLFLSKDKLPDATCLSSTRSRSELLLARILEKNTNPQLYNMKLVDRKRRPKRHQRVT